tara:strand:+ start:174 stop:404 length:231 start_codon:yes stop_codon:yes gene_type:complete
MNLDRLNAARKHYEGIAAEAEVTIEVYLTNAAGIGEHPQIMEELRGQIELLTDARDHIDTIVTLLNKYEYKQQLNG